MKKISLQWRLTCIITLYIALVCGCLTLLVYKNGIYYIDSLQETVDARGDDVGERVGDGDTDDSDQIYISIPEDKWDEFAKDFSVQVYNNKADYKKNSLILSALLALLGGVATYFISGHALRPIREFSEKIEEVQAQNLADSRIEENKVKELNQLHISYNKMLNVLRVLLRYRDNLRQMQHMSFELLYLLCRYSSMYIIPLHIPAAMVTPYRR